MAGQWIKFDKSTPRKSEVMRMARLLNVDRYAIVGRLAEFWAWTDDVSVDGVVDGVVDADVDAMISLPGFSGALEAVKWASFDRENHVMRLPNFSRHNGETSKKRALKSARQAKWRDGYVDATVDATVDAGGLPDKSIKKKKESAKKTKAPKPKITWSEESGFDIPAQFLASFESAYPAVDIAEQVAKAHVWCLSNDMNRPKSAFSRFLNGWFGRAAERAAKSRSASTGDRLRDIMKGQA